MGWPVNVRPHHQPQPAARAGVLGLRVWGNGGKCGALWRRGWDCYGLKKHFRVLQEQDRKCGGSVGGNVEQGGGWDCGNVFASSTPTCRQSRGGAFQSVRTVWGQCVEGVRGAGVAHALKAGHLHGARSECEDRVVQCMGVVRGAGVAHTLKAGRLHGARMPPRLSTLLKETLTSGFTLLVHTFPVAPPAACCSQQIDTAELLC